MVKAIKMVKGLIDRWNKKVISGFVEKCSVSIKKKTNKFKKKETK